jgi:hypothetical protein
MLCYLEKKELLKEINFTNRTVIAFSKLNELSREFMQCLEFLKTKNRDLILSYLEKILTFKDFVRFFDYQLVTPGEYEKVINRHLERLVNSEDLEELKLFLEFWKKSNLHYDLRLIKLHKVSLEIIELLIERYLELQERLYYFSENFRFHYLLLRKGIKIPDSYDKTFGLLCYLIKKNYYKEFEFLLDQCNCEITKYEKEYIFRLSLARFSVNISILLAKKYFSDNKNFVMQKIRRFKIFKRIFYELFEAN